LEECLKRHSTELVDVKLVVQLGPGSRILRADLWLIAMNLVVQKFLVYIEEAGVVWDGALSIVLNRTKPSQVVQEVLQRDSRVALVIDEPLEAIELGDVLLGSFHAPSNNLLIL